MFILRKLHNFCLAMNWLPKPVISKRLWPEIRFQPKRAITLDEHQLIIEREKNPERRSFYELCWHLGGSQTDIANLKGEGIDWRNQTIAARQKTGSLAMIHFRPDIEAVLARSARPAKRRRSRPRRFSGEAYIDRCSRPPSRRFSHLRVHPSSDRPGIRPPALPSARASRSSHVRRRRCRRLVRERPGVLPQPRSRPPYRRSPAVISCLQPYLLMRNLERKPDKNLS